MRESLKEEMEEFSNFVWYLMSYLNIDIPHQQIRNWMFCQVHNKETLFLMSWSPRASLLQGIAPLNGTGENLPRLQKEMLYWSNILYMEKP